MYEAFYGLREKPFSLMPDTQFLYRSPKHLVGLLMLEYGLLNQAGFVVLTGEVGCGKTLLIRQLLSRRDEAIKVGVISNANHAFGNLLQWICLAYGLQYRGKCDAELYEMFASFLVTEQAAGRRVVLIVDEAQNLGPAKLEELRVLSNLNTDSHLLLQIILVGQPELREQLQRTELRQFAQRIGVDHHLPPLSTVEARRYIWHRLRVAGGRLGLIDLAAVDLVCTASRGVPRLINQLCDSALVYGYAERQRIVDRNLVLQVVRDRAAGGLLAGMLNECETAPPAVHQ
jgi:type II secretory pathway predicted ATPase ExeA